MMSTNDTPIYSLLSSDPDLKAIVKLYVNEMPRRIARLESSLASGSWFELFGEVHQLRGSAGSHGFTKLTPCSADVERLIKSKASDTEIQEATKELIARCRLVTSDPAPESDEL